MQNTNNLFADFCFQDDSYVDSYISTIGVDFVGLAQMCNFVILLSVYFGGSTVTFDANFSENKNCGPGWEDYQAADCELRHKFILIYP